MTGTTLCKLRAFGTACKMITRKIAASGTAKNIPPIPSNSPPMRIATMTMSGVSPTESLTIFGAMKWPSA